MPSVYRNISIIDDFPLPLIPMKLFKSGDNEIFFPSSLPPLNVIDFKYDILKHPNVLYTTDGQELAYNHGKTNHEVANIVLDTNIDNYKFDDIEDITENYVIISSEELEEYYENKRE